MNGTLKPLGTPWVPGESGNPAGWPKGSRDRAWLRLIASKSRIGRIRLAVRRGFIVSDGQPITIRQVLERAYPRQRRFTSWHYLAARRALRKEAIVIARGRFGRGRPNLWAPIGRSNKDSKWCRSSTQSCSHDV
jgi:hypothetical protein